MGEIRSTLDIIMEKTRHLSMDPKERAELEANELGRRARGTVASYLDERKDRHALAREVKSLSAGAADAVRSACRAELLEHLSLPGSNERVLGAVEALEGPEAARAWDRACRDAAAPLLAEHERGKDEARERFRALLATEGLTGTALTPADAGNPFLREAEQDLARRFRDDVAAALGRS